MNRTVELSEIAFSDRTLTIANGTALSTQHDAVFADGSWIMNAIHTPTTDRVVSTLSLLRRPGKRVAARRMQSRLTGAIRANVTESLEVRQVLTDDYSLESAVDGLDTAIDSGLAVMEAKIRSIFSDQATPVIQNLNTQIDENFDEIFLTPAAEGSGADIDPQIDQDLHGLKNDAHNAVANAADDLLTDLQPMTKLGGYDWGIPMDFTLEGPYLFWMSDTMIVSVNTLTGDEAAMVHVFKTNPSSVPGMTGDTYEIDATYSRTGGVISKGFTGTRDQHNADGTYVNSWVAEFSQVGAQPATFDINRVFKSGPVGFSNHTTVQGGVVTGIQMASTYDTPVLKFNVGYHEDPDKVLTGGMQYTINDHLEITGSFKQTDVGRLFQSGTIYRFNDNNWVRSYVGGKEFNDPLATNLYVAGMELSLKTNDPVVKYYSGTYGRFNSSITRFFGIVPLPRGAKSFLQLQSELQMEQSGVRQFQNEWGGGGVVQGLLEW